MTVDPRFAPAPGWPAQGGYPGLPEHPRGTTVLVLGILALTLFVTGPFAWYVGAKAEKEIAAGTQRYSNERDLHIGRLLGMIATIVWGSLTVIYVLFIVVFVGLFASIFANFPR